MMAEGKPQGGGSPGPAVTGNLGFRGAKPSLADLFPAGDYRFHLTLRRGEPGEFFRAQDASGRLLAERRRWLEAEPGRYSALEAEGELPLAEVEEMAAGWGVVKPLGKAGSGEAEMRRLGSVIEPDLLLLAPDSEGQFRLRGGALCFPTGWALADKLGHTLDFIHGVVPGLNVALGSPIQQFLGKLRPGVAFHRDNWGLAATDELNLHPTRASAPPVLPVALDRLWLRVEHQALVALPRTKGVLFGIRIALHRLDGVAGEREAARGLAHALRTMTPALAAYKQLSTIREPLAHLLENAFN